MKDIQMLTSLDQVKAISDPLRIRILELLSQKPLTTKQAAEIIHENVNKLYHHVETLEKAGLIELKEVKQNRGTLEKYYQATAKHFTLSPVLFEVQLQVEEKAKTSELTFSSALQATLKELKQSLEKGHLKNQTRYFERMSLKLTPDKAKEIEEKFDAFIKACEAAHDPKRGEDYGMTATFYKLS